MGYDDYDERFERAFLLIICVFFLGFLFLVMQDQEPKSRPQDHVINDSHVASTGRSIDPAAQPYVDMYLSEKGKGLSRSISIEFADLDGTTLGECYTGSGRIRLDSNAWDRMDGPGRAWLVFHELGHCDLMQDHVSSGRYHIMDVYHPQNTYRIDKEDWPDLLAELFGHPTHGQIVADAAGWYKDQPPVARAPDPPVVAGYTPRGHGRLVQQVGDEDGIQIYEDGTIVMGGGSMVVSSHGANSYVRMNDFCVYNGRPVQCED